MNILVNEEGFSPAQSVTLEIDPASASDDIDLSQSHIAILFPNFGDGRGFGLAAALRRRGYKGKLRAKGHILADQYAMARRVGFDEIEITAELAERQDESQWLNRANWQDHNYQRRLGQMR